MLDMIKQVKKDRDKFEKPLIDKLKHIKSIDFQKDGDSYYKYIELQG